MIGIPVLFLLSAGGIQNIIGSKIHHSLPSITFDVPTTVNAFVSHQRPQLQRRQNRFQYGYDKQVESEISSTAKAHFPFRVYSFGTGNTETASSIDSVYEYRYDQRLISDTDYDFEDESDEFDESDKGPNDNNESIHPRQSTLIDDTEDESLLLRSLPEGSPKGFYIIKQYTYDPNDTTSTSSIGSSQNAPMDVTGTSTSMSENMIHVGGNTILHSMNADHIHHLGLLDSNNITLPIALMILDPTMYPSLSRARKACRKGNVLIIRSNTTTYHNNASTDDAQPPQQQQQFIGRVGDRVYTGDTVGIQVRMGNGYSFAVVGHTKPPFDVPVIYQDDHYALVNKPAGVVCYRQGSGSSSGLMSIRAALPFVLDPPQRGTFSVLRRPASVHRLDKPTSGLLCIVKTKPAMVHMSRQFHDRIVQKTYTAIINGIPEENSDTWITSERARQEYGIDIDCVQMNTVNDCNNSTKWQLINAPLDGQHAITLWRVLKYVPSLRARDGYITLIECKPKTGRYHQLRRHMAWIANRAMVGDTEYDGNHPSAVALRGNGLFLCATGITHEHPYYNTIDGRCEFLHRRKLSQDLEGSDASNGDKNDIIWYNTQTDKVMVSATIEPPTKFQSLLRREDERYKKLQTTHT